MSAIVQVYERNGASPGSESLCSNLNFGSADQANLVPATYPISKSVSLNSFEKWLRILVSNLGTATIVDNFKVWISDLGTGFAIGEVWKTNLTSDYKEYVSPVYAAPVNTVSTIALLDMSISEPIQGNIGVGGLLSGTIAVAGVYTDYIVIQVQLSTLTPIGALSVKVIHIQWDEQ